MISIVAAGFNSLAIVVYKVFLIASFVGKLIVSTITGITNAVYKIFENLVIFLQILYEDNILIFTDEIPNFLNDALEAFGYQVNHMLNGIGTLYYDIMQKLCGVVGRTKYFTDSILFVSSDIIHLLKNTIVFIGNAIWLIITFFPVYLPQLLQVGFRYMKNLVVECIVDAYMVLLKCTNFMSDVPLESFVGIISAIIIVRLCVHFRASIVSQLVEVYWSVVRKLLYVYYTLYNYITDSEVRVITHMASGQDITARDSNISSSEGDDGFGGDALCIICQERQKCVLTLPCRHVCLCGECCRRLYSYQRTCPICRTFIYHSVTVYL